MQDEEKALVAVLARLRVQYSPPNTATELDIGYVVVELVGTAVAAFYADVGTFRATHRKRRALAARYPEKTFAVAICKGRVRR